MIGRRVQPLQGKPGEVVKWEPLGSAMCDVLVRDDEGRECWYASYGCRPIDGLGDLPSRRESQRLAKEKSLESLKVIREKHIENFDKPWPGCEFGKGHFGMMLDKTIKDLGK